MWQLTPLCIGNKLPPPTASLPCRDMAHMHEAAGNSWRPHMHSLKGESFFLLCLRIKNNSHGINHFSCRAGLLRRLLRRKALYNGPLVSSTWPSF